MNDSWGGLLAGATVILAVLLPALLLTAALVYILARRWTRRRAAAWSDVAEQLGLRFRFEQGQMTIEGVLDGVLVRVDTTLQRQVMARVGRASGRAVPWTYAQAGPATPLLEMRPRHEDEEPPVGFTYTASGDPLLEERYRFYVAAGASLDEALPDAAREVLRGSPELVFVTGGVARWVRTGLETDPERLAAVVRLCAAVARASRAESEV